MIRLGRNFFGEMTVNGREEQSARGAENGAVVMEIRAPASVQSADGGDHVKRTAVAAAQQQSINLYFIAGQWNKNTTRKLEQTFSRFVHYMLKKGAAKNVGDILSMVPVLPDQYVEGSFWTCNILQRTVAYKTTNQTRLPRITGWLPKGLRNWDIRGTYWGMLASILLVRSWLPSGSHWRGRERETGQTGRPV